MKDISKMMRRRDDIPPFGEQLRSLFFDCMRPLRIILSCVAGGWSYLFFLPGNVLDRPAYHTMKVLATEQTWAIVFASYAVLSFWRIFFSRNRTIAALINLLGLILFTIAGISFYLADLQPTPATLATECGMAVAAWWVMVRTASDDD